MPIDDLLSQALGNPALQQGVFDTLQALFETGTEQSQDYKRQQRAVQAAGAAMMGGVPGAYGAAMPAISQGLMAGHKEYGRLETQDIEVREHAIDRAIKAQMEAMQQAVALGRNAEARRHNLVAERLMGERNNIQRMKAGNARQRSQNYQFNVNPVTNLPMVFDPMTGRSGLPDPDKDFLSLDQLLQQGQAARQSMNQEMGVPQGQQQMPQQMQQQPQMQPQMQQPQMQPQSGMMGMPQSGMNRATVVPPAGAQPGMLNQGTHQVVAPPPMPMPTTEAQGFEGDVPVTRMGNNPFQPKTIPKYGKDREGNILSVPVNAQTGAPAGPVQAVVEDVPEKKQAEYDSAVRVKGLLHSQLYPKLKGLQGTPWWKFYANQKVYSAEGGLLPYAAEEFGVKSEDIQSLLSTAGLIAVQMGHVYAGSRLGIQLLKWFNKHVPNNQDTPDQMRIKAESLENLLDSIIDGAAKAKELPEGDFLRDEHLGLMLDANGDDLQINVAPPGQRKRLINAMDLVNDWAESMGGTEEARQKAYAGIRAIAIKNGQIGADKPVLVGATEGGLVPLEE